MQKCAFLGLVVCTTIAGGRASAQTAAAAPAFEVASIRQAAFPTPDKFRSGQIHLGMRVDAAGVDIGALSLGDLLPYAYRVKPYQISGPSSLRELRWDIVAKLPEGASTDQVPEMMQALLAERFHLAVHREMREQPVYELVEGKGGSKLQPPAETDDVGSNAEPAGGPGFVFGPMGRGNVSVNKDGRGAVITGGPMGTARVTQSTTGGMHIELAKVTMAALADTLSRFVDRPVLDRTALKGSYQVTLDLPMEAMMAMAQNAARNAGLPVPPGGMGGGRAGGPGEGLGGAPMGPRMADGPATASVEASSAAIFQAIEHLGLKLQPRKEPLETIVVDHLDKTPTEN